MLIDMQNQTVIVSPKYQVVIPREIREACGIKPGSRMSVFEINGVIQLVPVKPPAQYRGLLQGLSSTDVANDPKRFDGPGVKYLAKVSP
jgi:AbrB family looped-hinge helix DNA binding protein